MNIIAFIAFVMRPLMHTVIGTLVEKACRRAGFDCVERLVVYPVLLRDCSFSDSFLGMHPDA
jgi:hypothetical protein